MCALALAAIKISAERSAYFYSGQPGSASWPRFRAKAKRQYGSGGFYYSKKLIKFKSQPRASPVREEGGPNKIFIYR